MTPDEQPHYAVIDIGSNSVRLVVYQHLARAPLPRFNEKSLCGLGRGLAETGSLARMPGLSVRQLADLLPWNWSARQKQAARAA